MRMLAILVAAVSTLCAQEVNVDIGCGHRGMILAQIPFEPIRTVAISIQSKLEPLKTDGDRLSLSYSPDSGQKVLYRTVLDDKELSKIPKVFWNGWLSGHLSPFDSNAAFVWDTLVRIEGGRIRLYPRQAQAEAQKLFGLNDNQKYLGMVYGYRYFWEKGNSKTIFGFKVGDSAHKLLYIKLNSKIEEPLCVFNGDRDGEIGIEAVAKPSGWYPAPRIVLTYQLHQSDALPVQ